MYDDIYIKTYRGEKINFNAITGLFFVDNIKRNYGGYKSIDTLTNKIDEVMAAIKAAKQKRKSAAEAEEARRQPGTYFMVHARGGGTWIVEHATRGEAVAEASRLAKITTATTLDILECKASVFSDNPYGAQELSITVPVEDAPGNKFMAYFKRLDRPTI